MERQYPHLGDTEFPHLSNIDVWKYRNNFEYSRWEDNARIKFCTVNWDSGYVNVVDWKNDTARDAYFDNLPGCKLDEPTMFQVQPDDSVKLPVPFNAANQYNYLVLEYPVMPDAENPLQYAAPARTRYYYFCEAVEELAPSTTLCKVSLDVWTTFINSVDVSGMLLSRGHAPMAKVSADAYLSNPYANQRYVTTQDVSFGTFSRTPAVKSHVFNSDVWAMVSMTGNPVSDWGTKGAGTWKVPASVDCRFGGHPSQQIIAVEPANLNALLLAMRSITPQAFQTISAVWFCPKELVGMGTSFTFAGVTVTFPVSQGWTGFNAGAWSKRDFGYDARYADMAKLYTYPYARIMCHSNNGDFEVRVEDTEGNITVQAKLNLIAPYLTIDTYVRTGGTAANLAFEAVNAMTMPWAGDALKTLVSMDIPTFAVYLDAATENDYATHFSRAQQNTAAQNAYTSAIAAADTALTNANNNVQLVLDNMVTTQSAQKSLLETSQDVEDVTLSNTIQINNQLTNFTNNITQTITDAQNDFSSNTAVNTMNANATSEKLSIVSTGVGAISGVVGNGLSGNIGGMANSFVGGVTELLVSPLSYSAQVQAQGANVAISISTRQEVTDATKMANTERNNQANLLANTNLIKKQNGEKTALSTQQSSQTTQGNRSAGVQRANNQRSYDTSAANAQRARSTALSAIENQIKQAALGAPLEAGTFANAGTASTRPLGWVFEVQTQDAGSIEAAAAHFARYGYALSQYWDFEGWQVMKSFTYWQCEDVWVVPRECTQGAAAFIRELLIEGTTVWENPAIIGSTSIWEN